LKINLGCKEQKKQSLEKTKEKCKEMKLESHREKLLLNFTIQMVMDLILI
jgi:hypothetical protein